ncbi:MAG: YiiX/YebB-like N1pC/P60 family cysteine hydrolase [Vulcanimicrobiota bacterium]
MKITNSAGLSTNVFTKKQNELVPEKQNSIISDQVTISKAKPEPSYSRIFGTIGAAAGAAVGRLTVLSSAGAAVAALAGSALIGGPVAPVILGVCGFAAGLYAEKKTRIGRFIGGIAGGLTGAGAGKVADLAGKKPEGKLAEETRGFGLKSLLSKLWKPKYTSHKKISSEEAKRIVDGLKPGDLIITNHDGDYKFEIAQKLLGKTGNWTHIGLVDEKNNILEALVDTDGPVENKAQDAIEKNHHVMVLRPNYNSPESARKAIQKARDYLGEANYDFSFNLGDDSELYCQEYIYNAMQHGAPEVKIEPTSFLGKQIITADEFINSRDMKTVYNTGSNFWMNYLSKFD